MSIIGEQIKKYRVNKEITQEQLGQMIGVTTQAVSKWERGGVPDAESIPLIADALGVSTDILFGRENTSTIIDMIIDEIQSVDKSDAMKKIFHYLWAASMALLDEKNIKDSLGIELVDNLKHSEGVGYYSRFCLNEGIMDARLNSDFKYFFFMPEPEMGFCEALGDTTNIAETMSVFSNKDSLKILFFMYTRLNTPLSLSLISSRTEILEERAEKLLKKMCDINIMRCSKIETENGFIMSYTFFNETVVLPLLYFAKEIREEKMLNWGVWFGRSKPLF